MATNVPAGRDIRLDIFRGVALWLIFLDHIPFNIVNWITIRNYGFSDAADMFVFISGYTTAFVYGRTMRERGVVAASARILKRAWQIYVAHVFLFVIYLAEIGYVGAIDELRAGNKRPRDFSRQEYERVAFAIDVAGDTDAAGACLRLRAHWQ